MSIPIQTRWRLARSLGKIGITGPYILSDDESYVIGQEVAKVDGSGVLACIAKRLSDQKTLGVIGRANDRLACYSLRKVDGLSLLTTGYSSGTVEIWNINDPQKKPKYTIPHSKPIVKAILTLDGQVCVSMTSDWFIYIWDLSGIQPRLIREESVQKDRLEDNQLSKSKDRQVLIYGTFYVQTNGQRRLVLNVTQQSKKYFDPRRQRMDLHLWDLETGQALHQVELVEGTSNNW